MLCTDDVNGINEQQSAVIGLRCSPVVDRKHSAGVHRRSPAADLQTDVGHVGQLDAVISATGLGNCTCVLL